MSPRVPRRPYPEFVADVRLAELEKVGEGRVAEVFAWGDGEVIKLYRNTEDQASAVFEAESTIRAGLIGAPAPTCRGTELIEGRTGVILERLRGPVLGDLLLGGAPRESAGVLAELHASIHELRGSGLASIKERMAMRIERAIPEPLASAVLEHLAGLAEGTALIHSDLHPFNVMSDGVNGRGLQRWLIIDWDAIYRGPPAFELARTLFLAREAAFEEGEADPDVRLQAADEFLSAYERLRPIDRSAVQAWRLPVLAARIDEGIAAERNYLMEEIVAALEA